MKKSSNSRSAVGQVRKNPTQTPISISEAALNPGDKVVVVDMFGVPTGIVCTVKQAEKHVVAVTWNGGGGITVGRPWLRKVS